MESNNKETNEDQKEARIWFQASKPPQKPPLIIERDFWVKFWEVICLWTGGGIKRVKGVRLIPSSSSSVGLEIIYGNRTLLPRHPFDGLCWLWEEDKKGIPSAMLGTFWNLVIIRLDQLWYVGDMERSRRVREEEKEVRRDMCDKCEGEGTVGIRYPTDPLLSFFFIVFICFRF